MARQRMAHKIFTTRAANGMGGAVSIGVVSAESPSWRDRFRPVLLQKQERHGGRLSKGSLGKMEERALSRPIFPKPCGAIRASRPLRLNFRCDFGPIRAWRLFA